MCVQVMNKYKFGSVSSYKKDFFEAFTERWSRVRDEWDGIPEVCCILNDNEYHDHSRVAFERVLICVADKHKDYEHARQEYDCGLAPLLLEHRFALGFGAPQKHRGWEGKKRSDTIHHCERMEVAFAELVGGGHRDKRTNYEEYNEPHHSCFEV